MSDFCVITVMPKRVDLGSQQKSLAQAAIAAIDELGLESVRLRDVAMRAAATTGAVTHYFDGKDALLEAAADEILRRLLDRTEEWSPPCERTGALDQLCAVLPCNAEIEREWRVWLAFAGRAVTSTRLRARHQRYYAEIAARLAAESGLADVSAATQWADAVIAAVDGIGLRASLEPDAWPPARQRDTLNVLLDGLWPPKASCAPG